MNRRAVLDCAALALLALAVPTFAAERAPRTFTLPIDPGTTMLTVEVTGQGRICGPARVMDNTGRTLMALGAGHCISTER